MTSSNRLVSIHFVDSHQRSGQLHGDDGHYGWFNLGFTFIVYLDF